MLAAFVNVLSAVLALAATLFYVFVYTLWLKRTSTQNIVIGGAAGAVPVLVGWAAVTGSLGWAPLVLFAMIFLLDAAALLGARHPLRRRLPGRRRADAPGGGQHRGHEPQDARLHARALGRQPRARSRSADLGLIYGLTALVLGAAFISGCLALRRNPTPTVAMRVFSFSITYVTLLFAAIAVDTLVRYGW